MAQSLDGLIVQIAVNDFHFFGIKTVNIHTEPVILGGDTDALIFKIFDRMIGAVMAEL